MKKKLLPIVAPLIIITFFSNIVFVGQLVKGDFTNWRLYSAAFGTLIISSMTIVIFRKLNIFKVL